MATKGSNSRQLQGRRAVRRYRQSAFRERPAVELMKSLPPLSPLAVAARSEPTPSPVSSRGLQSPSRRVRIEPILRPSALRARDPRI